MTRGVMHEYADKLTENKYGADDVTGGIASHSDLDEAQWADHDE